MLLTELRLPIVGWIIVPRELRNFFVATSLANQRASE
jgi:hypothetical protein